MPSVLSTAGGGLGLVGTVGFAGIAVGGAIGFAGIAVGGTVGFAGTAVLGASFLAGAGLGALPKMSFGTALDRRRLCTR